MSQERGRFHGLETHVRGRIKREALSLTKLDVAGIALLRTYPESNAPPPAVRGLDDVGMASPLDR
jgi:hypothetical protein